MSQNNILLLPTGSDRNKIEALAEQINQAGEAIKTLEASSELIEQLRASMDAIASKNAQGNLLPNGDINLNMALLPNPPFINTNIALPIDLTKTIEYGRNAIAAGFGWGYEISNNIDNAGHCKHEIANKSPYSNIQNIPKNNGVLKCTSNGDAVLYTVFSAPQGGKAMSALKGRILIGASDNADVTIGLARVIVHENTAKIRILQSQSNYTHVKTKGVVSHYLTPSWIETPALNSQLDGGDGLYVLYAHVKNDTAFMVYGAEAFYYDAESSPANGTTVTTINPLAMQQYHNYFRLVKKDCSEVISERRIRWRLPRNFAYAFSPEHHITTFHNRSYEEGKTAKIVEYGSNYLEIEYSQALFDVLTDNSVLSVSYSANPVGIRFYET